MTPKNWIKLLLVIIALVIAGFFGWTILTTPSITDLFQTDPYSYWVGIGVMVPVAFVIGALIRALKDWYSPSTPMKTGILIVIAIIVIGVILAPFLYSLGLFSWLIPGP